VLVMWIMRFVTQQQDTPMKDTRKIAEEVMAYSKEHEEDALASSETWGDMKYVRWEIPYYCMSVEELEEDIISRGYTSTKHAIAEMTKLNKIVADYIDDIKGA